MGMDVEVVEVDNGHPCFHNPRSPFLESTVTFELPLDRPHIPHFEPTEIFRHTYSHTTNMEEE